LKLQRISALAKKDLKRLVREPATLFLIILFPVILTSMFGISFGGVGGGSPATYQIGVVNQNQQGQNSQWSNYFIGNLTATDILKIQAYQDNETAQSDLIQGKIQAVVLIPNDFGQSCTSFWTNPTNPNAWLNSTLELYLDSGSMFATQALPPIFQQALTTTLYGRHATATAQPIQLSTPSLVQVSKTTAFDFMAPGIFAYASIFLTMTVAQSFTTDRENGLLTRINITPTSPTEFMLSQTISNMIAAFAQAILVFIMAYAVGFRPNIGPASYILAFIIVLIFSLCNVGFGLITATLAKSSGAATGLSFVFILPQMFLGTFVGAALSGVAQSAGKFVPAFYVTDALTSLMVRGAPITSSTVVTDIAVVSATSVAVLLIGILIFKKYGKA
jgi:ABC-type multidrug transport system permease subunit